MANGHELEVRPELRAVVASLVYVVALRPDTVAGGLVEGLQRPPLVEVGAVHLVVVGFGADMKRNIRPIGENDEIKFRVVLVDGEVVIQFDRPVGEWMRLVPDGAIKFGEAIAQVGREALQ